MTRIFLTLATANALAILASFVLGCVSKWGGDTSHQQFFVAHFLCGLFTAVGTLLVHCLIFTYFLGTGRWVREVTLAYDLPDEPLYKRTRELKRVVYPAALAAMIVTIAASAAGGGVQLQGWPWVLHFLLAIATVVVNFAAFVWEYAKVKENGAIIERVMVEVDQIRAAAGLPSNAESLAEDPAAR